METHDYHKLIGDLEKAINALDTAFFCDARGNDSPYPLHVRVALERLHQRMKDFSYYKCQIIDELIKQGVLKY